MKEIPGKVVVVGSNEAAIKKGPHDRTGSQTNCVGWKGGNI